MKVLVSNPFKQYAHQLCYALQQSNNLLCFITSIWYNPEKGNKQLWFLPKSLKEKVHYNLKKRSFNKLNDNLIQTYPLPEILRQFLIKLFKLNGERLFFYVERLHDLHVANTLASKNPDIVIAYEKAALSTFKRAKELGIATILDLAQVHYSDIKELNHKYSILKGLLDSERLLNYINNIKEQEYQYADYILVLSEFAKKTLLDKGIKENKIKVANLGFNPTHFRPKISYQTKNKFRLLFVGSIMRRKGIQLLLEAFVNLKLQNAELVLVGPVGDAVDILKKYEGSYIHIPFLHHEDLVKQYQEADIFVFPSYLDSWAMVVLEAMACGTPVIVTENTGACEAVQRGGGFVIPIHDLSALKEKIMFFYNNGEHLEIYGKQAVKIAQQYTWEAYYSQVVKNIEETKYNLAF